MTPRSFNTISRAGPMNSAINPGALCLWSRVSWGQWDSLRWQTQKKSERVGFLAIPADRVKNRTADVHLDSRCAKRTGSWQRASGGNGPLESWLIKGEQLLRDSNQSARRAQFFAGRSRHPPRGKNDLSFGPLGTHAETVLNRSIFESHPSRIVDRLMLSCLPRGSIIPF